MPFLVLSIRCTFLRQTLGATPGGERLKRELTVNPSLSQGQKETLPVFSFCSTNVEQIDVFIVSDSTSYQFSPHSSKVVVFFQVVSRGRILSHNTTDPSDMVFRNWSFRVTPQMSPSARLIGYYIDNSGRVVADSILLDIEDSLPTEVIKAFAYEIET